MMNCSNLELIYDKYCPMLYGIALELCESKLHAEDLIIKTFKTIYEKDINLETYPSYCITLIKLIIQSAEELYPTHKMLFRFKQFEQTPFINQLICEQISWADCCKEKYLTPQEAIQVIRAEFRTFRTFELERNIL